MKTIYFFFVFFLYFYLPFASSQIIETIQAPKVDKATMFVNTKKQKIQSAKPRALISPREVALQQKWNISLAQHGVSHGSEVTENQMDSIKQAGGRLKQNSARLLQDTVKKADQQADGMGVTPYVNNSFKGNSHTFWAPPDNSMAVSDDGYVVSVINTSILFTDINGNVLLEQNFNDYLSALNLNGLYFDPKVLYDPVADKFILVVLNGNTPATSTIVVGFSSAGNPNEDWWFYTFAGDPTGSNLWFDYPSIGVSTDDLYISGNLFTADRVFDQVLIYQFEKGPGFTGGVVDGIHFADVRDAHGIRDFTVVPISFGFDGSIGPGIYFVSTNGTGGYEAMMYYTDNNSKNNPTLFVYSAQIPNYYTPFDGLMLGTTDKIKSNDCRTLTGFYASGTLHFAFNNRGDDFHTKVYYCRLNTNDLTQNSVNIGQQPYECAYPSIAPFTTSVTDKTVLIGFLRTGGAIYPEFRMITVDDDMNFAGSHLVKSGKSFVDFDAGPLERWGDYTGISRRHSANSPEVWISGSYGALIDNGDSNVLSTWIAQITDQQPGGAPVANFTGNPTVVNAGQSVTFTDQSTNAPTTWAWSFPGGTPASSTVKNPVVTYHTPGSYSVTLVAGNNAGNDSETKAGYITVNAVAQPPVANFSANQTTIQAGQSVSFSDQSTNAPTSWAWSFPGGMPASSTVKNPVVKYNTPGAYSVTLVASNNAGNDSETKATYIIVNPLVLPPVADFKSDVVNVSPGGIVAFEDLSANAPTSWQWSFPGGLPDVSNLQNPIIIYPSAGCFDVTLVAANAAGHHAVTKTCYINVPTTSAQEQNSAFSRFVVFPNPVLNGRVNIEFEIGEPTELDFYVVDNRGMVTKNLLHRRIKEGLNNLAFDTEPLSPGVYYIVVRADHNALLKSEKFIVVR